MIPPVEFKHVDSEQGSEDSENLKPAKGVQQTIVRLVGLAIAMFVFAMWVMPPLYNLFCEVTGLNGKTGGRYEAVKAEVDVSRSVEVQFIGVNNESMPWGFKPANFSLTVNPGQAVVTHFKAKNPTGRVMVGQAIPSVSPANASSYFHKTECFCFNQQVLGPFEEAELGLQFIVDQALPKAVKTITLSYTLFDVTENSAELVNSKTEELKSALHKNLDKNLDKEFSKELTGVQGKAVPTQLKDDSDKKIDSGNNIESENKIDSEVLTAKAQ